jgi:hypothetical protein
VDGSEKDEQEEKKMTRALPSASLVGVIVCAAVTGCTSMAPPEYRAGSPPPCTPEWQVNVRATVSGGTASVAVNPEPAPVNGQGGGVRWTLHAQGTQNLAFTSDGIVIPSAPPGAAANSSGPSQYLWCFGPTSPGSSWKYTIKFFDTAVPSKVWTCDPTVVSSDTLMLATTGQHTYSCS